MTEKIWANSGDSHFLEPETLWRESLPPKLAELVPYTERDPDGLWETIHIDGMSFRRMLPTGKKKEFFEASMRAPGARDISKRMVDLNQEGIWAELVFPSLGVEAVNSHEARRARSADAARRLCRQWQSTLDNEGARRT